MLKVFIIGAGGVGWVVIYKCVQYLEVFFEIMFVSCIKFKCDVIVVDVQKVIGYIKMQIVQVDVDNVLEFVVLINFF